MQIDTTRILTSFDGLPVLDAEGEAFSLGRLCSTALQLVFIDEAALDGEKKLRRWELAGRLYREGTPDLTAEEIALCKKLIAKAYGPAVVGPAWTALDPKTVPERQPQGEQE